MKLLSLISKIKKLNKQQIVLYTYILALFFLTCPYYYLLPFKFVLFNTYFLSRIITGLVFLSIVFLLKYNFKLNILKFKELSFSILLIFVTFATSVIKVENPVAFLKDFEGLLFAVLFYFNTVYMVTTYKQKFINIFFITIISGKIVTVADELILLLNREFYLQIANTFLYQSQIDFLEANNFRSRLYLNKFNEAIIPTPKNGEDIKRSIALPKKSSRDVRADTSSVSSNNNLPNVEYPALSYI